MGTQNRTEVLNSGMTFDLKYYICKKQTMKSFFLMTLLLVFVASCGTKVPFTDQIRQDFDLSPENMIKVQFFTSSVIILEKSKSSGNQTTGSDGTLVQNQSKTQDRIIIPAQTKCVFEKQTEDNAIVVRFELGTGKTLKFATRAAQTSGKYYLVANWTEGKSGTLEYGNESYSVAQGGSSSYLLVQLKKLQKTKRKDRIVKGMKV